MSAESFSRGFIRKCAEVGIDYDLLAKVAAVRLSAARPTGLAGTQSIRRGMSTATAGRLTAERPTGLAGTPSVQLKRRTTSVAPRSGYTSGGTQKALPASGAVTTRMRADTSADTVASDKSVAPAASQTAVTGASSAANGATRMRSGGSWVNEFNKSREQRMAAVGGAGIKSTGSDKGTLVMQGDRAYRYVNGRLIPERNTATPYNFNSVKGGVQRSRRVLG